MSEKGGEGWEGGGRDYWAIVRTAKKGSFKDAGHELHRLNESRSLAPHVPATQTKGTEAGAGVREKGREGGGGGGVTTGPL